MFGVVAASNSASLVTNAVLSSIVSVAVVISSSLPGTSGNSRPQAAVHVTFALSPPAFKSVTTVAIVMSLRAASSSAALKSFEVATTGGILGKVTEVGEQFLTLEIASGVSVKLQKFQVAQVLPKGTVKSA